MEKMSLILGLGLSMGAIIISFFTFFHNRRELYANIIVNQRLAHMGKVTELIYDFIDAYVSNDIDIAKALKYKIIINLNPINNVHKEAIEKIDKCITAMQSRSNDSTEPKEFEELMFHLQVLFKHIWEEARSESYSRKFRKNKPKINGENADKTKS
jgi:hypothetical protein